jgi:hypothetical protein
MYWQNSARNIEAMIALVDRALALNPSYVHGWFRGGAVRVHVGKFDLAIEHVETSLPLSTRERLGAPFSLLGVPISWPVDLERRHQSYSWRSKNTRPTLGHTAFSPHAMHTWDALMKHEISSNVCERLRPQLFRTTSLCVTLSTAGFCCLVYRLQLARRHEPDQTSRRDPCRQYGRVFAPDRSRRAQGT